MILVCEHILKPIAKNKATNNLTYNGFKQQKAHIFLQF